MAEDENVEAGNSGAGQASPEIEKKRSAVRRRVTYAVIYAYLGLAVVVVWLMWAGRYEVAIGVLGGVAGPCRIDIRILVWFEASHAAT